MEILSDDNASESRFPLKKPLPPIGTGGENDDIILPNSETESENEQVDSKDDDDKSTASNGNTYSNEVIVLMSQYTQRHNVIVTSLGSQKNCFIVMLHCL